MLLLLLACVPNGPGALVHAPAPDRGGEPGALGPHGAAWLRHDVNARVTERLTVEVVYPADDAGWLAAEDAPYPAVALVPGGRVPLERYRWLAAWLATRGYVVVGARPALGLALLESDDTAIALSALERWAEAGTLEGAITPGEGVTVVGHSLGGVVATVQWLQDPRFEQLALLASYPDDFSPVEEAGGPVLSLVGAVDGSAPPADCHDGWLRFPGPGLYGEIEGMNHYAWTDDPTAAELAGDGAMQRPVDEARVDGMRVLDTFLDAWQGGSAAAMAALDGADFPGVEAEPR